MREDWVDRWKGLLIVFVVLGHVVGVAGHFAQGTARDLFEYVYKVVYCFHMPAFFCVTGYLWKTRTGEKFRIFCWKKTRRLIVPYLVFALLSGVIYYFASGAFSATVRDATDAYYKHKGGMPTVGGLLLSIVHAGGWPNNGVFRASSVLWFLPAMFTVCVVYFLLDRIFPRKKCVHLVIGVLLLVISHIIPAGLPWGLSLMPYYIFFVILGRWLLPWVLKHVGERMGFVLWGGLLGYLIICWFTPNAYCRVLDLRWRLMFAAMAIFGACISALLARRSVWRGWSSLGLMSLGIMLLHKYVVLGLGMKLSLGRQLFLRGGLLSVLMTLSISVLAIVLSWGGAKIILRICPELLGGSRK